MFKLLVSGLLFTVPWVSSAQTAIGVVGSAGTDHAWVSDFCSLGVRIEQRPADSSLFSLRLLVARAWLPDDRSGTAQHDPATHAVTSTWSNDDQYDQWRIQLDTKWPLSENECPDGYHRGAYAVIGGAYARTVVNSDRTYEDHVTGTLERSSTRYTVEDWMLVLGAGLQRQFAWGGLYAEAWLSAGAAGISEQGFMFPSQLALSAGYRYVFWRKTR